MKWLNSKYTNPFVIGNFLHIVNLNKFWGGWLNGALKKCKKRHLYLDLKILLSVTICYTT